MYYLEAMGDPGRALAAYNAASGLWFDDYSEELYYSQLALVHLERSDWDSAIPRIDHAIPLAQSRGDIGEVGCYYQNKGIALRAKGQLLKAREYYVKALEIAEQKGDRHVDTRRRNLRSIDIDIDRQRSGTAPESVFGRDAGDPQIGVTCALRRPLEIFLSHSSKDKHAVRKLASKLTMDGFKPWLDEEDIAGGREWGTEIERAIGESDVVIVCLSPYAGAKDSFVHREVAFAQNIGGTHRKNPLRVIPILLEKCTIPDALRQYQWIDYSRPNGYSRLVRDLVELSRELGLLRE